MIGLPHAVVEDLTGDAQVVLDQQFPCDKEGDLTPPAPREGHQRSDQATLDAPALPCCGLHSSCL